MSADVVSISAARTFAKIGAFVRRHGKPLSRVLLNEDHDATTVLVAVNAHSADVDVVFERDDGWTLGASSELEYVAHGLYRDRWIARWEITESDGVEGGFIASRLQFHR